MLNLEEDSQIRGKFSTQEKILNLGEDSQLRRKCLT